jgi:hypothetical protein
MELAPWIKAKLERMREEVTQACGCCAPQS